MKEDESIWHDLCVVLAELPNLEMAELNWVAWDAGPALRLRIGIWARNSDQPNLDPRFNGLTELRCQRVTDWSLRPIAPNWLLGGPRIVYHDKPDREVLRELGFTEFNTQEIPHADDVFDPPLELHLLVLERGFVIAERFEIAEVVS
jgi:hypothetical protein